MKRLLALLLLAVAGTACGPPRTPAPPPATTTPAWSTCGVGLPDHNVRIWVEGYYAQQACEMIISSEKAALESPVWWTAATVSAAEGYFAVCADNFSDLRYEVVDTGGASYGTQWCQWMTQQYGTAPYPVERDLFGLVR